MTPRDIILRVRDIVTDTDSVAYRQSDEELLRYINDAIKDCSKLAPQLFYTTGDMACIPGKTEQSISFADAQALAEIVRVKDGKAILPCDMATLSAFMPDWSNAPEDHAIHWMRHEGDPLRFYLYPKAPAGQVIEIKYVKNPDEVGLDDEITELSPTLLPDLANYVVSKAESKDDEHVNSGRSTAAYQQFMNMLKPGG